jgi:uncharacterized membrane protein (UPF0136 family)
LLDIARLYLFVFGILTIGGGVLGFVKAKSRASLIAGSISGLLLLAAGYLVSTHGRLGFQIGLGVSLALAVRFIMTFRKSKKLMPAGLMAVLGLVGVALCVAALAA